MIFKYFDILFIRIYNQYIQWNEDDIPKLTSILILSFFQSMNVLAAYFFVRSLIEKDAWVFPKIYILPTMVLVLAIDYLRIFKIIGFNKLLLRYSEPSNRKLIFHPILYFVVSIAMLVILKVVDLFPHVS